MATNYHKLMNNREYMLDQMARKHLREEAGGDSHAADHPIRYEVIGLPSNTAPLTSSLADRLGCDIFAELKGRLPESREGYLPN